MLLDKKLIKIADRSEFGWHTVEEYLEDELADNSDDEKRLGRAEGRAKRKPKAVKEKKSKNSKKFGKQKRFPRFGQPGNSPMNWPNPTVSRELLNSAIVAQSGASSHSTLGPCFRCGKAGHLRRNCPLNIK